MRPAEQAFRAVVSAALVYEAVALQVESVPTITAFSHRHPTFAALVVGWLVRHFIPPVIQQEENHNG